MQGLCIGDASAAGRAIRAALAFVRRRKPC